ncbi:hypothetical protein ACIQCX_18915 [Enterobacter cancerogenus]|uniref:hypothetical protein n=1 Tax=Enterobacter cancerogenus TaxID=69218 RepID=UPI00380A7C46
MMKRVSSALFIVVLMVAWIFLPSIIIPSSYSKVFQIDGPDNKYKVIIYHGGIISPMSLYKYLNVAVAERLPGRTAEAVKLKA